MKANELRIGSIILLDGIEKQIDGQDLIDILRFEYSIEPIPLTEELWKKISEDDFILSDKSGFVIFKNGYAYQFIYSDYPYLHQLQNLYFCLCGKELELNLHLQTKN